MVPIQGLSTWAYQGMFKIKTIPQKYSLNLKLIHQNELRINSMSGIPMDSDVQRAKRAQFLKAQTPRLML